MSPAVLSEELAVVQVPVEVSLHEPHTPHHELPGLPWPEPLPGLQVSNVGRATHHQGPQAAGSQVQGLGDSVHLCHSIQYVDLLQSGEQCEEVLTHADMKT